MHRDKNDARLDHAECARCTQRYVDYASFDEGTTIVDAAVSGPVAIPEGLHDEARNAFRSQCELAKGRAQ